MKKRIYILILSISYLITLTGCWNRMEFTDISINTAKGYDLLEDGKIMATTQIVLPSEIKGQKEKGSSTEGGSKGFVTISSIGLTTFDAGRNATKEAVKKMYGGHNAVIVIGEKFAEAGIFPAIDQYFRDHDGRPSIYVVIARGLAKDILEVVHPQEKIPAKAIEELLEKGSKASSKVVVAQLYEIMKTLSSDSSQFSLPGIEIIKKEEGESFAINGTAVFKKDKLIGWLDDIETKGLLWITDKVKSGTINVRAPGDESKYVTLEIMKASSKIVPKMINNKPVITIKVKEESNFANQQTQINMANPEIIKELESRQTDAIKKEIEAALLKGQKKFNSDIFKFGEAFHQKQPKQWKTLKNSWDQEFRNLEVEVEIETKIRKVYMVTSPVKVE